MENLSSANKGETEIISGLFTSTLLEWNRSGNTREMPWKGEKDPYKIWLSEIILQQTRVEQGLKYYERFVEAFPTVQHLAQAPDEQVFKLWEGLGYYSRCKNLLETARYISQVLNGVFPDRYEDIIKLKGVGSYTAAAIASFAFNQPYAVLDGNVFRVLARIYDVETPIDTVQGKNLFARLAMEQLSKEQPGIYNQAIMDFGAVICKPFPDCGACFYNVHCKAFVQGRQLMLPVKEKKIAVKERWFNYIVVQCGEWFAIKKRASRDIWQNLYEFPLIETQTAVPQEEVCLQLNKNLGFEEEDVRFLQPPFEERQRLTHQLINFSFYRAETSLKKDLPGFLWVARSQLSQYPFPKSLQNYLQNHIL